MFPRDGTHIPFSRHTPPCVPGNRGLAQMPCAAEITMQLCSWLLKLALQPSPVGPSGWSLGGPSCDETLT